MKKLLIIFLLYPILSYCQIECVICTLDMRDAGMSSTWGTDGNLTKYVCPNGHVSLVKETQQSSSNSDKLLNESEARQYDLNNSNEYSNSVSVNEHNALIEKYNNLLTSYNKLKIGYDKLLRERNSNRTSSNSPINRQSSYSNVSKSSSNYIKPGISFTHLKQPKIFGGDWGRYTSGATNIEFIDNKLYNNYYRKVRVKGNVGYINMNTFKQ